VKSLRANSASLGESYAGPKDGAIYLINAHIPEYQQAGVKMNHEPRRPRKLLLHKREQERLMGQVRRGGYTLVPIRIYFNNRGLAKCELGLAKGKKQHDKRQTQRDRDWQRQKSRLMRNSDL
jgi:SsrA-binding protein